jgi:hypothetical protein
VGSRRGCPGGKHLIAGLKTLLDDSKVDGGARRSDAPREAGHVRNSQFAQRGRCGVFFWYFVSCGYVPATSREKLMMTTMTNFSFGVRAARAALAGLALMCTSSIAGAAIIDTGGFEAAAGYSTTFNGTGQLEGQVPATFNGTWLRTLGPGLSTATVQSAVVASGQQAVQVDKAPNSDDRWAIPVSGYPSIGETRVCISWDMLVRGPAGDVQSDEFGPLFGVEAYDDDAASIGLLGSLFVDATTGEVLLQDQDTGFLSAVGSASFNTWYNYDLVLDYASKTYSVYQNNVLLGSAGFVDENNVAGGLGQFTDADIAAIAGAGNAASQALIGTAFIDNFAVHEGAICIPEPAAFAMCLLGLTALPRRRQA